MKQSEINIKKPDGKIIQAVSRCKSPDYKSENSSCSLFLPHRFSKKSH